MQIPLPLNIEFKEWGAQMRNAFPNLFFPIPPEVENWKTWASQVVINNTIINIPLPTDQAYVEPDDWKKWAAYLVNSLYNTTYT